MKKKFLSLIMATLITSSLSLPTSVLANDYTNADELVVIEQGGISPRFSYIMSTNAGLTIDSSNKAYVNVNLVGNSTVTSCKADIILQKKFGTGWYNAKSWSASSNSRVLSFSDSYSVSSGEYRLVAYVTAYSNSASETAIIVVE